MQEKKTVLGALGINWENPADVASLPREILHTRRMVAYLDGWSGDDTGRVRQQLTIFDQVPLQCRGAGCRFADTCPLVRNGTVSRFAGTPDTPRPGRPCPLEIIEAFRHFAGYVNDLKIEPSDYVDIQMLNDLVRMHVQMRRCDQMLSKEDPVETLVEAQYVGNNKKQDVAVRQVNQLLSVQLVLRRAINDLYTKLMASREQKFKERRASQGAEDAATLMSAIRAQAGVGEPPDGRGALVPDGRGALVPEERPGPDGPEAPEGEMEMAQLILDSDNPRIRRLELD